MGCDIHFFVERYTDEPQKSGPKDKQEIREENLDKLEVEGGNPKRWKSTDNWEWEDNSEWDDEDSYWTINYKKWFFHHRNYLLFAILAGVRTYTSEFKYQMSEPRGWPEDVSYPLKIYSEQWGIDIHSKSYFTLPELKEKWSKIKPLMIEDMEKNGEDYSYTFDMIEDIIQRMSEIDDDPKNVRCVFAFDN